jgi:hypothetical protein
VAAIIVLETVMLKDDTFAGLPAQDFNKTP